MTVSYTEQTDSGVGSNSGLEGGEANRVYLAIGQTEDEDWVGGLQDAIPFGTRHNKPTFYEYKAHSHHEMQYVSPTSRIMLVTYRPANDPSFSGWVTEVEFSAETEEIYQDVPLDKTKSPKEFRSPAFRPRVGPKPPTQPYEFFIVGESGNVPLERLPTFKRLPRQVLRGSITFSMRRQVDVMTWKMIVKAASHRAKVNKGKFIEFEPRTVLFANMGIEESFGPVSRGHSNFFYNVRLQFVYKPVPWTPIDLNWVFEDENGFSSGVKWSGFAPPADSDWIIIKPNEESDKNVGIHRNLYGETDFYVLLDGLGAGSPPTLNG